MIILNGYLLAEFGSFIVTRGTAGSNQPRRGVMSIVIGPKVCSTTPEGWYLIGASLTKNHACLLPQADYRQFLFLVKTAQILKPYVGLPASSGQASSGQAQGDFFLSGRGPDVMNPLALQLCVSVQSATSAIAGLSDRHGPRQGSAPTGTYKRGL